MLEPSTLAPRVTITLLQAWLSIVPAAKNAAESSKMAFASLLILSFYYNYLILLEFCLLPVPGARQRAKLVKITQL
jgi:hypothetical protein